MGINLWVSKIVQLSFGKDKHVDKRKSNICHYLSWELKRAKCMKQLLGFIRITISTFLHFFFNFASWLRWSRICLQCSISGSGRSPREGNGTLLQYFGQENSLDRGAWRLQSMGLQRVKHNWATFLSLRL